MKNANYLIVCTSALLFLSGCSTKFDSQRVGENNIGKGYAYTLPETRLKVKISAQLIGCNTQPIFKFTEITTETESIASKNKNDIFFVDIDKLKSGMKAIPELKFESYDNTTLKSISYKATDKTGEAIKSVARVVALYNGISLPSVESKQEKAITKVYTQEELCSPSANSNLKLIEEKRKELSSLSTKIYDSNSNATLDGFRIAFKNEIDKMTKTTNEEYKNVIANIGILEKAIEKEEENIKSNRTFLKEKYAAVEKELETLYDNLTKTVTLEWTPYTKYKEYDLSFFNDWLNVNDINVKNTLDEWLSSNKFKLTIKNYEEKKLDSDNLTIEGLYYRVPKPTNFELTFNDNTLSLIDSVPISQFGYLGNLNINNGPFDDNTYSVNFNEAGNLHKFEYSNATSAIENATNAIEEAADTLIKTDLEKVTAENELSAKKAELATNKQKEYEAELAKIKAKKTLEDYIKELDDDNGKNTTNTN